MPAPRGRSSQRRRIRSPPPFTTSTVTRSPSGSWNEIPRALLAPVPIRREEALEREPLHDGVLGLQPLGDEESRPRGRHQQREHHAGNGAARHAREGIRVRAVGSARRWGCGVLRCPADRPGGSGRARSGWCRRGTRPARGADPPRCRPAPPRSWPGAPGATRPPGKRKSGPAAAKDARSSGSSRSMSSISRPSQRPQFPSASRSSTRGSMPIASLTMAAVSRARSWWLTHRAATSWLATTSAASVRACSRPRAFSGGSRLPCTRRGEAFQSVSPWRARRIKRRRGGGTGSSVSARRPRPKRLQGEDVVRQHVAQVHVRAELLDEPDLLVLLRRLEDQLGAVHLVHDLVDQPGARLAVGAVEPGVAGRPALAGDERGAGVERGADQAHPAVRGEQRGRVLLADLGEHREAVGERLDQLELLVLRDRDRAARHLHVLDAELAQPAAQAVDPPVQPGQLGQRPAEHHGDARGAVRVELRLEVARDVGRAPAQPDQVHVVARAAHEPLRLGRREAGVDHVRDPGRARLRGPRRQVEEVGHPYCWALSAPRIDDHVRVAGERRRCLVDRLARPDVEPPRDGARLGLLARPGT